MEKTTKVCRKDALEEILSNPLTAKSYCSSLEQALEMCHEILYDLTWEKGGKLDPLHEPYVVAVNRIVKDILELSNE